MITEFGKLLRIIRINTGDSARTMAEKFGMSPSYLSTIENGKRNIPPEMEELVIRAYDLSEHDKEKLRKTIIDTTAQLRVMEGLIQMEQGRILVITGSPGTGKTTTSSIIAKESSMEKSVHMHTDDFYHYLSKNAIPPHLPQSNDQNLVVIESFLEAAKRFARGGYDVIVDGIIGPWFLEPWLNVVQEGYEVHYIILRTNKEETIKRAIGRSKLDRDTNIELVETMWEQFCNLGIYEKNVIDTTNLSINDTVLTVKEKIRNKTCLLHQ